MKQPPPATNPNHPVVRELEQQWHKLAAVLLWLLTSRESLTVDELGVSRPSRPFVEITAEDLEAWQEAYPGGAIVADTRGGTFVLRLATAEEGAALARAEGGLAH